MTGPTSFDAVVLAGGSARRMGGADKPALTVGGTSLLDRVLLACGGADQLVVVGPQRAVSRPVTWAREHPVGGGPTAALAAGLAHVTAPVVAVLAADLPFLEAATLRLLSSSRGEHDGVLLVDDEDQDQLLVGMWCTGALRARIPDRVEGLSLRHVLPLDRAVRVTPPRRRSDAAPWLDCDTPDDLAFVRRIA